MVVALSGKRLVHIFFNAVSVIQPGQCIVPVQIPVLLLRRFQLCLRFPTHQLYQQRDQKHRQIQKREPQHKFVGVRIQQQASANRCPKQENHHHKRQTAKRASAFDAKNQHRKAGNQTDPKRAEPVGNTADEEKQQQQQGFRTKHTENHAFAHVCAMQQQHIAKTDNRKDQRGCQQHILGGKIVDDRHHQRCQRQRDIQKIKQHPPPQIVRDNSLLDVLHHFFICPCHCHYALPPPLVSRLFLCRNKQPCRLLYHILSICHDSGRKMSIFRREMSHTKPRPPVRR